MAQSFLEVTVRMPAVWRTPVPRYAGSPAMPRCRDAAILYIHGSGFMFCSLRTHRGLVSRISSASNLPVFSLEHRRGPEHQFPAAHDDALAGYRWLLAQGYRPERVVVAGDSAGGHLREPLLGPGGSDRPATRSDQHGSGRVAGAITECCGRR
jgi:acetyl esterase/lipase